jgi:hypothetical protein
VGLFSKLVKAVKTTAAVTQAVVAVVQTVAQTAASVVKTVTEKISDAIGEVKKLCDERSIFGEGLGSRVRPNKRRGFL